MRPPETADWVDVVAQPLPVVDATAWATRPEAGAVVCFLGVVRDHSEGRTGVRAITYEAYESQARRALDDVAAEARRRWPAIARLAVLHRTGPVALSEASVVVICSAPHRTDAFEAARFAIDTLKQTAPIWKQEHSDTGSGWSSDARPIRPVAAVVATHSDERGDAAV